MECARVIGIRTEEEAYHRGQGKQIYLTADDKCGWNHRLAFYLARKNQRFSRTHPDMLKRIHMPVVYVYMRLIRVLLSF